ncbi:MAG: hypothetical protein KC543_02000 [Myxococcales bacterium]|nr:hypothetical protein [Myxococcales bacterium]
MESKRDLTLGLGALIAILLVIAFGATGLFIRMAPAIHRIVEKNDSALAATEKMLVMLASQREPAGGDRTTQAVAERDRRFVAMLDEARAGLEGPAVDAAAQQVREHAAGAFAGDAEARVAVVGGLETLASASRDAMRESDRRAGRLGAAGAWAGALLGFAGFVVGLLVFGRIRKRLLEPLDELHRVVLAAAKGDSRVRCRTSEASKGFALVMRSLNEVLDHAAAPSGTDDAVTQGSLRYLVRELIDQRPEPVVVVDDRGGIEAANREALELLRTERGGTIRAALRRLKAEAPSPDIAHATKIEGSGLWLCVLAPESAAA